MKKKGPWSDGQIQDFLAETRLPLRIACNGASGYPVLVSLWFVPLDGKLWCATQRSASVVSHLRRDGRCAFELAEESSPYRGVRGQALASLNEDRAEPVLRLLIERYLGDSNTKLAGWLLERVADETAIVIEPQTLVSWDYSRRMEPVS